MSYRPEDFNLLDRNEVRAIEYMYASIGPVREIPGIDQFTVDTLMLRGLVIVSTKSRWRQVAYCLSDEGRAAVRYLGRDH